MQICQTENYFEFELDKSVKIEPVLATLEININSKSAQKLKNCCNKCSCIKILLVNKMITYILIIN